MRHFLLILGCVLSSLILAGGCKTSEVNEGEARAFDGKSGYQVEPFDSTPNVTADTYFAAGQFHETSTTTNQKRLTAAQQERQVRQQQALAIKQYQKALEIDANHHATLFRMGVLLTDRKEFEQAEVYWNRYVKATKGSTDAWMNLAVCQEVAGRTAEAESSYRQVISIEPNSKVARTNLGMLLARDGRLQEAAAQLSSVLEPASVHWHLAHALAQRGQTEAANRHFRAAASLDPMYRRDGGTNPQGPGATAAINPAE